MKENQITLINEDGSEELANILFTHENKGTSYVVFEFVSDGTVSAAKYIEGEDGAGEIEPIETDLEWEMLDDVLDSYYDELEAEEEDEE